MTTKDYVYLGLMALAALIFYCHGFYSGVSQSRRLYAALQDGNEPPEGPLADYADESDTLPPPRHQHQMPSFPRRELRGDFGNN